MGLKTKTCGSRFNISLFTCRISFIPEKTEEFSFLKFIIKTLPKQNLNLSPFGIRHLCDANFRLIWLPTWTLRCNSDGGLFNWNSCNSPIRVWYNPLESSFSSKKKFHSYQHVWLSRIQTVKCWMFAAVFRNNLKTSIDYRKPLFRTTRAVQRLIDAIRMEVIRSESYSSVVNCFVSCNDWVRIV